jgi:TPP-dependent pyruvate/acetoin dehydrogenase alpha subunit
VDRSLLIEMHRRMLRIRRFDERAVELARRGEIPGALHTSTNQEAAVVGATMALRADDYMTGNHRSHGHPIGKGADLKRLFAELLGKRTGICKGKGGSMHLADFGVGSLGEAGIIASAVPVAVGAALSAQVRGTDQVSLTFFGDGASNAGAVHESMNLAAVWKLGVVFFCENNHWAVTTSVHDSTSVPDIASRGAGYGMPGVVVDGQDPVAVYEATAAAVARARAGAGPSIVEAKTYRVLEHAEGIPVPADYRDADEVARWRLRDPIPAFAARLVGTGVLTGPALRDLTEQVEAELTAAVDFALDSPFPAAAEAFDDLYANPIVPLARPDRAGAVPR